MFGVVVRTLLVCEVRREMIQSCDERRTVELTLHSHCGLVQCSLSHLPCLRAAPEASPLSSACDVTVASGLSAKCVYVCVYMCMYITQVQSPGTCTYIHMYEHYTTNTQHMKMTHIILL